MTEEIKRIIHYDERRKILSVKTEESKEAKFGEVDGGKLKVISEAEYNEEGIKMILAHAQEDKEKSEKFIPMCKDRIKEIEDDMKEAGSEELTPELKELAEKLEKIRKSAASEPKKKELDNLQAMLKNSEETLKNSNKNIQEIKKEVGGRLKI